MPPTNLAPIAEAVCAIEGFSFIGSVGAGAYKESFHVQLADGTPQALKVYRHGASPQRAQREIDAMLSCSHPNIARLTSVKAYTIASEGYLVSLEEFLPGGTLTEKLQAQGLMTGDAVFELGTILIDAIGHVAEQGLVHRDLKPDNVMLREDRKTPVIVDFGLVRNLAQSSLTQTWALQGPGTPLFAPPEQLHNAKAYIDWRADQFSLGVLLSFALFGFHPYSESGDTMPEVVARVADYSQPTARFCQAAKSANLATLIKMVGAWPVERIRTPSQLKNEWAERRSS